jgi:hypothetical protein
MYSTVTDSFAIAQIEVDCCLSQQADKIAPEPKRLITQRKAKYHDKFRTRRKEVQAWVFRRTGLSTTAQVKAALKKLGIRRDLRLTSAWIDLNLNYCNALAPRGCNLFQKGDRVTLTEYSARIAYLEPWSPFSIIAIEGGLATLELMSFPVPLANLQLVS